MTVHVWRHVRQASGRASWLTVGVVSGLIFGGASGLKIASELDVGSTLGAFEIMLMGSAAASLSAWWALGLVMRIFDRVDPSAKERMQHGEK